MERLADNKIDKENLLISSMRGIHMVPMDIIGGFEVRPGMYEMNGAAAIPCGVNFTVYSSGATSCELFLFNKDNYLLDIYAKAVNGQRIWGVKKDDKICYKARVVKDDFDWGKSRNPLISMEDLIIYEMHVRGFSKHESSGVKHPGTFEGLREKIPYLKEFLLTGKEFDVLYFLASTPGRVYTKKQIYKAVWKDEYVYDDDNIMAVISKIRKKIEDYSAAPKMIQTIRGVGYRFSEDG